MLGTIHRIISDSEVDEQRRDGKRMKGEKDHRCEQQSSEPTNNVIQNIAQQHHPLCDQGQTALHEILPAVIQPDNVKVEELSNPKLADYTPTTCSSSSGDVEHQQKEDGMMCGTTEKLRDDSDTQQMEMGVVGCGGSGSSVAGVRGQRPTTTATTRAHPVVVNRQDSKGSDDTSSGGSGSGSMRASSTHYSQASSRDWGWFEDVHYGSDPNLSKQGHDSSSGGGGSSNGCEKRNKSNSKKTKRSLVPHAVVTSGSDQIHMEEIISSSREGDGVSAMAVTAPNYVLEESLSSQKLWKDTAGTRPPQPVEERAFYEKMWAQNFARSQVNYDMPVEVLTATSPICLSPFADGLLETAANMNLDNYDVYAQPQQVDGVADGRTEADGAVGKVVAANEKLNDAMMFWNNNHHKTKCGDDSNAWEPRKHQHIVNKTVKDTNNGEFLTVLVRGDNVFGTTVSKSFAKQGGPMSGAIDTVNVSIASYRVVESKKHGKYAQFLVIYREGSIRDTIGVWKRYSDFSHLSKKVTQAHESCASVVANMTPLALSSAVEQDIEHLPNAITSWRLLKKRQRWYRCLDAGYLSLKVFLLERFLHDILFESSSPKLLRDFVGANSSSMEMEY